MPIITGTEGPDELDGTPQDDTIDGLGDDDTIKGGDGDDAIAGGAGNDDLSGDYGQDHINGGDGDDLIDGKNNEGSSSGSYADMLLGGAGNDRIAADYGDSVDGGTGVDTLDLSLYVLNYLTGSAGVIADLSQLANNGTVTIGGGELRNIEYVAGISLTQFDDNVIAGPVFAGGEGVSMTGYGGNDTLTGTANADWIFGGQGDDVIYGGGGTNSAVNPPGDRLYGEAGNDTVYIGADAAFVSGDNGNDVVYGGGGSDEIWGGGGTDSLHGGAGDDKIDGGLGDNALFGDAGNDLLLGGGGADAIDGGDGNDTLYGSEGADIMAGGAGDDVYMYVDAEDIVVEAAGGGFDRVVGTNNYILTAGAQVERLEAPVTSESFRLTGNELPNTIAGGLGNDVLWGVAGDDTLHGNDGADALIGGAGSDAMLGGAGDDVYLVDDGGDVVTELAGQGNDTIYTTIGYALSADSEVETLTVYDRTTTDTLSLYGNEYGQLIYGNNGANLLAGGGGADWLFGMGGNDAYAIDGTGDVVYEFAGGGYDVIYTTGSFSLSYSSEVELITVEDRSTTNALTLFGNALGQTLYGNAGNNLLNGGGGSDAMVGFAGDDSYVVDSLDDVVIEIAGQGSDAVYALGSYALGVLAEVELLMAYDRSATDTLAFSGSAYGQTIYGSMGTTFLNGNGGADVLYGLGGDDAYLVDSLDDAVIEFTGGGSDTVYASGSFVLTAGSEVEVLSVYDRTTSGAINLAGNELANTIYGNAGNNVIDGKGGSDAIYLMGGTDMVYFSTPLGAGNVDAISGFASGEDKLLLDSVTFAGLGAGSVAASAFAVNALPADGDDRLLYNEVTGQLLFDADGNGAGAAVLFAMLDPGTLLTASDLIVV